MTAMVNWSDKQLDLIRRTVAKDANADEFRHFVHICQHTGLDPLKRQAYCFVFHKDDPKKRQMAPVVAINGFRAIAARTGNYRPDNRAPRLEYDESAKGETNPLGIVRAEVSVFQFSHGEWFEAIGEAYWEEFAPIIDEWGENESGRRGKTGRRILDPKKDGWRRMGRLMIAKCAEAIALRKAWPDDFSAIYEESEVDRLQSIDTWEAAEKAATEARLEAVGAASGILIDWMDGKPLQGVPVGKLGDLALSFIQQHLKEEQPSVVLAWRDKNRHGLNEYWARDKDGALVLKKELEAVEASIKAEAAE